MFVLLGKEYEFYRKRQILYYAAKCVKIYSFNSRSLPAPKPVISFALVDAAELSSKFASKSSDVCNCQKFRISLKYSIKTEVVMNNIILFKYIFLDYFFLLCLSQSECNFLVCNIQPLVEFLTVRNQQFGLELQLKIILKISCKYVNFDLAGLAAYLLKCEGQQFSPFETHFLIPRFGSFLTINSNNFFKLRSGDCRCRMI